jgi:hypothetical protein
MFRKLYSTALGIAGIALLSTGAIAAPSQATFTAAVLGAIGTWTLVSPEVFGSGGGNGFFSGGGNATFELRLASYNHIFGTATAAHGGETPIFNTTVDAEGSVKSFVPVSNPFLFYFETFGAASIDNGRVFSDNVRENDAFNQLDMFVYQQGSTFAMFFDDGGPSGFCGFFVLCDDNDANDMVVTVTAAVPEPMSLVLFGAGLAGLAFMRRRKTA